MLQRLVDQGDSLVVIEHNLDVLKCADWLIDLGPEAEMEGGRIVAAGTPETSPRRRPATPGNFSQPKLVAPQESGTRCAKRRTATATAARADAASMPCPQAIQIRGARHHNLKNISVDIALNEMTVVTGLSGSGKSTLAFDLLFAEGQRRYLDSLNAYARQFVEQLERPDVDSITGIPPSVAIEQRVTRGGRKSTVATITEIFQFVRLLYAKLGQVRDPETDEPAIRQTPAEILARLEKAARGQELRVLAPLIKGRKGFHTEVAKWAEKKGYPLLRVDGKWIEPAKFKALDRYVEHTISVELGRFGKKQSPRRSGAAGRCRARARPRHALRARCARARDGLQHAAFLSRHGPLLRRTRAAPLLLQLAARLVPDLPGLRHAARGPHRGRDRGGARSRNRARAANGSTTTSAAGLPRLPRPAAQSARARRAPAAGPRREGARRLHHRRNRRAFHRRGASRFFRTVKPKGREARIARDILPEIVQRLEFLVEVGLGYLSLDRSATTLSGGESQRIRLAAQFGSELQGVLYVLDEPTIGLHPRDNARLLDSLGTLRDRATRSSSSSTTRTRCASPTASSISAPARARRAAQIVARGLVERRWRSTANRPPEKFSASRCGIRCAASAVPAKDAPGWCRIIGAHANNLKQLDVAFPAGRFIALCGVSGAGKSTLLHDVIKPAAQAFAGRKGKRAQSARRARGKKSEGFEIFTSVYEVDQAPIGKTSRSTPATYIGLMDEIRGLFARLPLARQRGYEASRFSFNSGVGPLPRLPRPGRGEGGDELPALDLRAVRDLPRAAATIPRRSRSSTTASRSPTCSTSPSTRRSISSPTCRACTGRSRLLRDTGLGYLTLGQRSPTLSGGEAQRIKLVAELARSLEMNTQKRLKTRGFGSLHHLYLLEEPTIGLHLADVQRLLHVLHQLVDAGHTVIVIEHHLDVLADADYLIELGPEGGDAGGRIIAQGTPEEVAKAKRSATAPFLTKMLRRD